MQRAKKIEEAEKIVFVTCSFKETKKTECFNIIKKIKPLEGELIVVGCLPGIVPKEFKKIFKGKALATKDLDNFSKFFPEFKKKFSETSDANTLAKDSFLSYNTPLQETFFARARLSKKFFSKCLGFAKKRIFSLSKKNNQEAVLRTSYGCVSNCAYCGIRFAIGNIKSKTIKECKKEFNKLLQQGKKEILLIADNVGAYGLDIGLNFPILLQEILKASNGKEIKLNIRELHPIWVIKYSNTLSSIIKQKKVSCLTVPLQSGSERLLKKMNRPSDLKKLLETIKRFKKQDPALQLGTHLLIGFPGETEKDIDETIEFTKNAGFEEITLYPYYDVPGTISYKMKNKNSQATIKKRLNRIKEELAKQDVFCSCEEIEDPKKAALAGFETILKK